MTGSKKSKGIHKLFTFDGETRTASGWSKHRGMGPHRVQDRLSNGWHPHAAILGEIGETKAAAHARLQLEPVTPIRPMHANRTQVVKLIEVDGVAMTAAAWEREKGLGKSCIGTRLKHGWDPRVAVLAPAREPKFDAHSRLGIPPLSGARTISYAVKPAHRMVAQYNAIAIRKWTTRHHNGKPAVSACPLDKGSDSPMDVMMRHRLMTKEEERDAFDKYAKMRAKHGDKSKRVLKLRNWLIARNMRLVALYAQRVGIDIDDRIMDGAEGLMVAVDRFEPSRGWRFSTYASWWIKHYIRRRWDDTKCAVRVPIHLQDDLKMGRKEVDGVALVCDRPMSLDAPIESYESNNRTRYDLMIDVDEMASPGLLASEQAKAALAAATKRVLDERERYIIARRFGLDGEDPETLIDIGERLDGISRERVRQVERDALVKLRRAMGGIGAREAWL